MKQLAEKFNKYGLTHEQMDCFLINDYEQKMNERVGVVIHKLLNPEFDKDVNGFNVSFVRVRDNQRFEPFGPYLALPSTESWGLEAFSVYSYEKALERFNQMKQKLEDGKDTQI
jgi:hypothetical protein